jgi:hypothetical protein
VGRIIVDVEPAEQFEFADAHDGGWAGCCEQDLTDWCVARYSEASLKDSPPGRI